MKISPQEKLILDLLADGLKHCSTFECYMKDDRARISALRKKGFIFNEGAGYCTDKTHNHHSQVKVRQLMNWPRENSAPRITPPLTETARIFLHNSQTIWKKPEVKEPQQLNF